MIIDPKQLQATIAKLQSEGKLPAGLSAEQIARLQKSLQKYSGEVGQKVVSNILNDFRSKIQTAQSMTDPVQMRGVLADLTRYVGSNEIADQIKFSLKISQEVASGGGRYLNQNLSPEALDEYPALELKRMFQRSVPRGFKVGKKGALIAVPDEAWDTGDGRWVKACEDAGDDEALRVFRETGRMVALKSSGVWQALGDGAGDYSDTLGNPFPPFAFNSGFMTFEVSRQDAVELGLLGEDEEAKPAAINITKLFAEVAA